MKKILFATDFSETCASAFEYLKVFVEGTDIVVSIVHMFHLPVTSSSAILTPSYTEWVDKKRVVLEEDLRSLMAELPINNRGAYEAIYTVIPATDIANEVKAYQPDLVVMGLRAKYTIVDRLVGTVTAQTIKKIDRPVLAIPFGAKYSGIDHILFPTAQSTPENLSESEENSLSQLFELRDKFDSSKVEMLHIVQSNAMALAVDITHKNRPLENMDYVISEASNIETGIQKSVENKSVDLIVVQKSKTGLWSNLFGSSVTRKLLLETQIPIIVFQ